MLKSNVTLSRQLAGAPGENFKKKQKSLSVAFGRRSSSIFGIFPDSRVNGDIRKKKTRCNRSSELRDLLQRSLKFFENGGQIRPKYNISNGEHAQKYKVFRLFFYNTPLEICIFNIFALITRRSKYDFWILDNILVLEKKIRIKKYFSEVEIFD